MRLNFKITSDARLDDLLSDIQSYYENNGFEEIEISITGNALLMHRTDKLFISSQIKSLLLALAIISLVMMLLFKSFKLGVFSMIVNLLPVLFGLGLLGFLQIKLDMGTVMIAPIAIGIAVDDTIHFLFQYQKQYNDNCSLQNIFSRVYQIILKPVVFTSIILAAGFGSNVISSFKPNIYFGAVAAVTLIIALVCDLFLLPSLLVVFHKNMDSNIIWYNISQRNK